jgi:hypothetical protein
MKKAILVISAVLGFAFIAQAADTNTTFSWQRPDQSGTLTISNLTLKGTVALPAGMTLGSLSTVTTNVTITADAPVTNVVLQTYVPTFILSDGTTNAIAFPTNIVIQRGAAPTITKTNVTP